MSNVRIDIAAVWKGAQAFNKATKATKKLDTQVSILSKRLISVYAANKVLQFSKKMSNAFAEDQKSAALLSNTLKNLGLQFANPSIETFIGKLSQSAGVADDQLRPAMQKLLQVTGSVAKSQELLTSAIDISRGSGVDFETVVSDLSASFVGNNKGLKKYALGLTQAELKTASFDTVMQQFNKNFDGSNAAYLGTYAGQMQVLTVAAGEAQETIGAGLVDAFKILAGDTTISNIADKMAQLATNTADFFRGLAQGFKDLANMPVIKQLLQLAKVILKVAGGVAGAVIDPFVKEGARKRSAALAPASANSFLSEHMAASNAAKAAKAEKDAKARAAAIKKAQEANTKELKKQALTKKQSALFDMDQIQLIAALKGKLSEEDRKRVELQLALLQGNEEAAAKLSKEVANSIDKTGNLAKYLQTLPDANNPFKNWDTWLSTFKKDLDKVTITPPPATENPNLLPPLHQGGGGSTGGGDVPPDTNVPSDFSGFRRPDTLPGTAGSGGQFGPDTPWARAASINVYLDSKQIAAGIQDQSLNGNQTLINRSQGNFG